MTAKTLRELLVGVKFTRNDNTEKHIPRENKFRVHNVNPNDLKTDGEDHINISLFGKTELGNLLSNEVSLDVKHNIFGRFRSVTSFWYYIKSKERDDRCRTLIGKHIKEFSKELTLDEVKNFRAIILDTVYQKINQYPAIKEAVKDSTLRFECYFEDINSGLRQRPKYFTWFLDGMEELRTAVKENREPMLSRFLDEANTGIYDFVIPPKRKEEKKVNEAIVKESVESITDECKDTGPIVEEISQYNPTVPVFNVNELAQTAIENVKETVEV
jgi:hypothetical protein